MTDDEAHRVSSRSGQRAEGRPEHKDDGPAPRSASVLTIRYHHGWWLFSRILSIVIAVLAVSIVVGWLIFGEPPR